MTSTNPFRYGALALDEAFTDREAEISELKADVRNGQDVVIFAPAPLRQDLAGVARVAGADAPRRRWSRRST